MICAHKSCKKVINNPRNAITGDGRTYCSSECFLTHDALIAECEEKILFIQSCIGVQRGMKQTKKRKNNPTALAECDKLIEVYKHDLKFANNTLKELQGDI